MPLYPPPQQASANVTVMWNVQPRPQRRLMHATVAAVSGTAVVLTFADGSRQLYETDSGQAAALRKLIGKTISFQVDSSAVSAR